MADRGDSQEAAKLLEVSYDRELNRTRVVVDTSSVEWRLRLNLLQGWRQADNGNR